MTLRGIKVETCRPLRRTSTKLVGFHGHVLYLSPNEQDVIDVYYVNSLVPKEQYSIFRMECKINEIQEYSMTFDGKYIYCFTIGLFNDRWQPVIFKIKSDGKAYNIYTLNDQSFDEFEHVYINNIGIHCGESDAYIYDRTLAKGNIPFWKIELKEDDKTFNIRRDIIPDSPEIFKCNRFPILGNPDCRQFMKTTDSEVILFFEDGEWHPYYPDDKNELDMSKISCRGINESYGSIGQRFTAIQTSLSIFSNSDQFIFKLSNRIYHVFYALNVNKENKTYKLERKFQVQQPKDTLFYRLINTENRIALVGRQSISFYTIKPLSLRELAFWKIQRRFGERDVKTGYWYGGITTEELKSKLHINSDHLLI